MNSGTGTNSAKKAEPLETDWSQVHKLPIVLFHTLRGPVVGRMKKKDAQRVQVFAPAALEQPPTMPGKVVFVPLAFVDDYIEMFWSTMFGVSRAPEPILKGYRVYFEDFKKGGYKLKAIVINAGVEGSPVSVEDVRPELQPCPACSQLLSHWAAHYPVLTAEDKWVCEISVPTVRDDYPGYDVQALMEAKGGAHGPQASA